MLTERIRPFSTIFQPSVLREGADRTTLLICNCKQLLQGMSTENTAGIKDIMLFPQSCCYFLVLFVIVVLHGKYILRTQKASLKKPEKPMNFSVY